MQHSAEDDSSPLPLPPSDLPTLPAPTTPPTIASLSQRAAAFHGLAFRLVIELLRHPEAGVQAMCLAAGCAPGTFYTYRYQLPGFRELTDDITALRGEMRQEFARAAFLAATPDVAEAMIERAKGSGTPAQRAGERILETVGVLRREGDLPEGTEAIDLVMLRLRRRT